MRVVMGRVTAVVLLGGALAGPVLAAGDPVHGEALFASRCGLCHTGGPGDGEGGMAPPLAGVVGRKAATAPGFSYSRALRASGLVWTPAELDRFLKAPRLAVPGTVMPIAVPTDTDRADIVAYLATLKP